VVCGEPPLQAASASAISPAVSARGADVIIIQRAFRRRGVERSLGRVSQRSLNVHFRTCEV
jgi:hypothetical protein